MVCTSAPEEEEEEEGLHGVHMVISRSIAEYLVQAWDVRNSCKHNGAVLLPPSAPVGRGADGVDAMA
jgi:hypothetical protein